MSYRPPPEHAQRSELADIPLEAGRRLKVRLGYYGNRLLVDFSIQLEVEAGGLWWPAARVDCCNGSIHRHQFLRSTQEDALDHLKWADIPEGLARKDLADVVGEGYDWAYALMVDEYDALAWRWRNG